MATNSKLATETLISPNRTHPRNNKIDTITIHCVVGQVTAKRGLELFQSPSRQASCTYVVGKSGDIGLCVDEGDRSWCSGGTLAVNGMTGKMNDHRAVTIEVACEPYHPYAVTDAAYEALIGLVADIAKRNGMGELKWRGDKSLVGKPGQQNMTVHRWFANKACPGQWLYERMGEIARRANEINYPTTNTETKEDEEMEKKEIQAMIDDAILAERKRQYFNTLEDVPESYRPTLRKLMEAGILKGYDGGADGLIATFEDNTIRVDETFCRIMTILSRPGAKAALFGIDDAAVYNTVDECPAWYRDAVKWAVDSGRIVGDEAGRLQLDDTKCWALQVEYNAVTKNG